MVGMSQPSLHLTLDTQTQDLAGDCISLPAPAPGAAAEDPTDCAAEVAAQAPPSAGTKPAHLPLPAVPCDSAERHPAHSSDEGGSDSECRGEEPVAEQSDSDEEAISGAEEAASDGSSSSDSSDSESEHEGVAQVIQLCRVLMDVMASKGLNTGLVLNYICYCIRLHWMPQLPVLQIQQMVCARVQPWQVRSLLLSCQDGARGSPPS
jgi:hypothetical protein